MATFAIKYTLARVDTGGESIRGETKGGWVRRARDHRSFHPGDFRSKFFPSTEILHV